MTDEQRERQALLVRAAAAEAKRQDARQKGDTLAERGHELELQKLWARFAELGGLSV